MTTVSVIIPTFNRSRQVTRAVSSVLYQTFRDKEIIVVDDGSTDDTSQRLAQFNGRITLLRHPVNRGVSAARNTGIRASDAPFIAFLDSDDYWLPEKLAVQVAYFQRHTDLVACQTQEIWIRRGRRVNPQKKHFKPSGDIFIPSLRRCLVSPSAAMLRSSLLTETGLFDETLPACEDYDLWLRISCRHPIDLIDRPLVVKEGGHPDQLSMRYAGMDRFRIKAMVKCLDSGRLDAVQKGETLRELSFKCRIYGEGCLKRGKIKEGKSYLDLSERALKGMPEMPTFPL